jgi:hypothetical protein
MGSTSTLANQLVVLYAFEDSRAWLQAARDAGPPVVAPYLDLLLGVMRERPAPNDALDEEFGSAGRVLDSLSTKP